MNLMLFSFMLRRMGLEPTRPTGHKILSLACLPISAPPRDSYNIQPRNIKVKKKISLIQKIFDHGSIKTESAELLQIFKLTHFEQYRNGSHPLLPPWSSFAILRTKLNDRLCVNLGGNHDVVQVEELVGAVHAGVNARKDCTEGYAVL